MKILAAILVVLMGILAALAIVLTMSLLQKRRERTKPSADPEEQALPEEARQTRNQRRHVRVAYPEGRQPMIRIRKHQLPVADISEKGLCFVNIQNIKLGKWVRGEITLHMGSTLVVEGQVVRKKKDAIGLSLITPIPYKTILAEERLMSAKTGGNTVALNT